MKVNNACAVLKDKVHIFVYLLRPHSSNIVILQLEWYKLCTQKPCLFWKLFSDKVFVINYDFSYENWHLNWDYNDHFQYNF